MPTNRTRRSRTRTVGRLTDDDQFFLAVGIHLDGSRSTLSWDDPRARELYELHKAALFERSFALGFEGWRPAGFWQFEASGDPGTGAARLRFLRDRKLLRADELQRLTEQDARLRAAGLVGMFEDYTSAK